ncbi:ATP-dependent helicase HrpB [Paenibacillus filicis]|uniref:ATP-dependent helicase HrpB n=1 Tax=Paenibacillus gyeongsangnamensis TaxID=3388067 RepID=A0ABT4QC95_9BACL|nr:ATP-dependent helicase HrpB [Paenibacillus filicis]MCZ8514504.1 ATP-dependent helicase HrpB [Paenibacillus filicis]
MQLPIEQALPALKEALRHHNGAVLVAPPGAGKTTRVPLAMLGEPWLQGQRILMLEPRRLAARASARYMASALGEAVGATVGYRVRLDTRVGPNTRIEVITEGVLTRMLQTDPGLEGVGLVIFDEFHERSLQADLGLALALQAQALLREDLRVLVMSATLEAEPVAILLGDAPVVRSEGRSYPVETCHVEQSVTGRIEAAVVKTVLEALDRYEGDVLVFLPGAREIRRTAEGLAAAGIRQGRGPIRVAPLYGSLTQEEQDLALAPSPNGERKVVLATSIAETSLTVEGVRIVIDSGLMRVPRFSPRTGLSRLETMPVSRASADQRRGRAGRVAPGVCYRLWTEQEDRRLAPRSTPEVLEADLAPLALELLAWGVAEPAELQWLDAPPAPAMAQARELLQQLGAVDAGGAITAHGRRMAELGLHPRLAHMLLRAVPLGLALLACELAALLGERDALRAEGGPPSADLRLRVEALRRGAAPPGYRADPAVLRSLRAEARQLQQALGLAADGGAPADRCGLLLGFAYPDRIAQRRGTGRFLLAGGRGAVLPELQPLSAEPYLVAAELDDQGPESRIFLAAPLEEAELAEHFADRIREEREIAWDRAAQAVRARRRERLGALVLREGPLASPAPEETLAALLTGIREEGLGLLPWSKSARQLQQRLVFLHRIDASWPDASDEALLATLEDWLAPHLDGRKSRESLQSLSLASLLEEALPWDKRRQLGELAPTHITVPSGSRIPVDYSDPEAPVLAVRLQEMFGLADTPRIAGGRVPLTVHLLSPASRPVQVTRDLASFWRTTYFEVKKDLKGRYPKHYWPDDPTAAVPTSRTKPRT